MLSAEKEDRNRIRDSSAKVVDTPPSTKLEYRAIDEHVLVDVRIVLKATLPQSVVVSQEMLMRCFPC